MLFSCVIPVKGKRPFLRAALASLRPEVQGIAADEIEVIVQDADVDPDKGQSDALNKGFKKAKGEWLFWLNADDLMLLGALRKVRELIEARERKGAEIDWIVGSEYHIDSEGKILDASVANRWSAGLYKNAAPHAHGPSSFFRRELLERVGYLDEDLHYCMDWDLWIRFVKAGIKYELVEGFIWAQRRWEGSKTQREGGVTKEELARHLAEIDRMLKKNDFKITRFGVWKLKIYRFLTGCYFKEWRAK